jgi:hypothetical protein
MGNRLDNRRNRNPVLDGPSPYVDCLSLLLSLAVAQLERESEESEAVESTRVDNAGKTTAIVFPAVVSP